MKKSSLINCPPIPEHWILSPDTRARCSYPHYQNIMSAALNLNIKKLHLIPRFSLCTPCVFVFCFWLYFLRYFPLYSSLANSLALPFLQRTCPSLLVLLPAYKTSQSQFLQPYCGNTRTPARARARARAHTHTHTQYIITINTLVANPDPAVSCSGRVKNAYFIPLSLPLPFKKKTKFDNPELSKVTTVI